jgi:CHAD domain-containing protein
MPYRFSDGEATDQGIRRIAGDQLDTAITELTERIRTDPVDAVHAARKALKKERSLLRLARGTMRSKARRSENAALRDAGRRLSAARDAEVMVQALDNLAGRYAGQLPETTFTTIRDQLNELGRDPRRSLLDSGLPGEVAEELKAARTRADEWKLRSGGWKRVKPGLTRSYKRGRRAFKQAQDDPSTERLHEWRKRAKDYWYHLRLLEPIAPRTMKGHAEDAHLLSDLLGDDHDLALLRDTLARAGPGLPVDVDAVMALLDHRRGQLQAQAMLMGARLYAEKPKAFRRRMRAYWKAWQAENRTSDAEQPARLAQLTREPAAT